MRPDSRALREPLADAAGVPVDDRGEQHRVDEVGVERVLDRDRLGLALGHDGAVVVGSGQRVEAGAVRRRRRTRTSSSTLISSSSATVWTPIRRSRSAVAGPTPGITVTCIGRSRSRSVPGGDDPGAVGLVELAGDLGDQLRRGDADRRGESAGRRPRRPFLSSAAIVASPSCERSRSCGLAARSTNASSSDSGSTSGDSVAQLSHHLPAARPGRRRTGRRGTPRAGTATAPRRSTSPTGRRTCAPRTTRSPPRRGRRRRRR